MTTFAETAAQTRSPYWHGMLCAETRDDIAARILDVLNGHYFTLVIGNSYSEDTDRFSSIEVYPSQYLTAPLRDYRDQELPGIGWSVPRLSMGVHTKAKTQAEARDGGVHLYVHFMFERDRIIIDHFAPAGYRLQWTFAVEHHDAEDGVPSWT